MMGPDDGLVELDEVEECRECGKETSWSDYVSWICPECYERQEQ